MKGRARASKSVAEGGSSRDIDPPSLLERENQPRESERVGVRYIYVGRVGVGGKWMFRVRGWTRWLWWNMGGYYAVGVLVVY